MFPRSEGLARLAYQFAEKYEKIGGRSDRKRAKELYSASPDCIRPYKKSYSNSDFTRDVTILNSLFVESLDLLVFASEDNNIYVWGFDKNAVDVLQKMKPVDEFLNHRYAILLENGGYMPEAETDVSKGAIDSVTNRVAGFICKSVFSEHSNCITGIVAVEKDHRKRYDTTFLISAGWDRKILIWDLEKLCLHDVFHNTADLNGSTSYPELPADGIIMDLTYSPERDEFAYAASDKLVYIRQFSDKCSNMKLTGILQGHEADVTQVKWNGVLSKWVTGSDDGSIRIWGL
ncbi:U5 small nuclear ribonucleo 40 kDa [Paramuricea clavata]|uniref:U5 small nuclear ribonucleo 40 kDa, partial n=1 Tax=Paramuricea clavata TaxID=317549 RepID=A0A7D9IW13_PARCT|nr:U5 small nuclear ribonucleo 40 kDa [Paramuricea clavata]